MSETSQGPIVGDRNCLACVYEHGTRHGLPMSISSGHVHTCTPLRDDPTEQPNLIFGNPRPFNAQSEWAVPPVNMNGYSIPPEKLAAENQHASEFNRRFQLAADLEALGIKVPKPDAPRPATTLTAQDHAKACCNTNVVVRDAGGRIGIVLGWNYEDGTTAKTTTILVRWLHGTKPDDKYAEWIPHTRLSVESWFDCPGAKP